MCGGHIFLTAPGDVWAKPGRNFNVLAGHDACFRAYNSMDLSTTTHDLRLKAERNLHLLGGNDGESGGVLIECKAPGAYDYEDVVGEDVQMGGFQVKVDKGDAVVWAQNIYLRTGGGDVGAGMITLDAAKGQEVIVLQGSTIANFVTESVLDCFGSEGNISAVNLWSAESNVIGAGCCIQGYGMFQDSIVVKGWIEAVGGHFGSELAGEYHGLVGQLEGESLFLAYQSLESCSNAAADERDSAQEFWTTVFDQDLYADKQPGNDDTITAVHFTFRNPTQYRTEQFKLFEDRWQQMARLGGEGLTAWEEKAITGAASEETMPYPGKAPWADDDTYVEQDLVLFDYNTGNSLPRGKASDGAAAAGRETEPKYEEPKFADPNPRPPAEGYLIIAGGSDAGT
jgi:hypothetical protein